MAQASGVLSVLVCLIAALAAQELPKHDSDESFEIEPPLLIPNRSDEPLSPGVPSAKPANLDPDRLERQLERTKKSAAEAERLFRMGVLAKVEVEQRALRVIIVESELEDARLLRAKEELAEQQQRLAAGEISKADVSQTEAALERATEAARSAKAKRQRAELEAAEMNLRRQQKLLSLGSGRKSEVARAEERVAELKATKESGDN
jgi:outer membrane protein TolC